MPNFTGKNGDGNAIKFMIILMTCCIGFQVKAQIKNGEKKTAFDWNSVSISAAEAKIFPRLYKPVEKKWLAGLNYDFTKLRPDFAVPFNPASKSIANKIDAALHDQLYGKMNGSVFLEERPHTNKNFNRNSLGLNLEYFILPQLSVILGERFSFSTVEVNFLVSVIEESSTGTKISTYPSDGSYNIKLTTFSTDISSRYYLFFRKKSLCLFPEFMASLLNSRGVVEHVMIRNVLVPVSQNKKQGGMKLGFAVGVRYEILPNLFLDGKLAGNHEGFYNLNYANYGLGILYAFL